MLRKAVCPECGSSNIRVQQFVRVILPIEDAQQEIDKDIINKETTTVIDDDPILTLVCCGECGYEISREVDFGNKIKNKDLTDELCKRLDELEQFRIDTFVKEFREELESNERRFSGAGYMGGSTYKESADDIKIDYCGLIDESTEDTEEDTEEPEDSTGIVWDYSEE